MIDNPKIKPKKMPRGENDACFTRDEKKSRRSTDLKMDVNALYVVTAKPEGTDLEVGDLVEIGKYVCRNWRTVVAKAIHDDVHWRVYKCDLRRANDIDVKDIQFVHDEAVIKVTRTDWGDPPKLVGMDFGKIEARALAYFIDRYPKNPSMLDYLQPKTQPEEHTMVKIENRLYYNDTNVADLSDEAVFSRIAQAEKEVTKLEAIEHKPKSLIKQIELLKEGIQSLVDFVDNR